MGAAQGVGVVLGSYISAGASYLGWKGGEKGPSGYTGSSMQGFGSDSYQGYMGASGGYSGNNYDPPGGNSSSYKPYD